MVACLIVVVRVVGLIAELGLSLLLASGLGGDHPTLLLGKFLRGKLLTGILRAELVIHAILLLAVIMSLMLLGETETTCSAHVVSSSSLSASVACRVRNVSVLFLR